MQDVIYQDDEHTEDALFDMVFEVGKQAFDEYDAFRLREGSEVQEHLLLYCKNIAQCIAPIETLEPERIENTKERLRKNIKALVEDDSFDKNRFEQELIYYLEKYDIQEEKSRLHAHCQHFTDALNDNPKGKSLNFIAQEMGREINTLGSKANHAGIQKLVIVMKEELEKIKEQTLNIL